MRLSIEVAVVIALIHIKFSYLCTYCLSSHNMCMVTNVTSGAIKNVICLKLLDFYVHIFGILSYLINELVTLFGSYGFESMLMTFLDF
jgi:hypothetical protein